jgi:hypothetical protein
MDLNGNFLAQEWQRKLKLVSLEPSESEDSENKIKII